MDDFENVKIRACSVFMYNLFHKGKVLVLFNPQAILYKTNFNLTGCKCES